MSLTNHPSTNLGPLQNTLRLNVQTVQTMSISKQAFQGSQSRLSFAPFTVLEPSFQQKLATSVFANSEHTEGLPRKRLTFFLSYTWSKDPLFSRCIRACNPDNAFSSIGRTPLWTGFSAEPSSDPYWAWLWATLPFIGINGVAGSGFTPAAANWMLFILSLIASSVPVATAQAANKSQNHINKGNWSRERKGK